MTASKLGKIVLLSALLGALPSCGAGRPYTADLSTRSVTPPTLMIASPIPRTLYIVVDADRVEDGFAIRNSNHAVLGFRGFLGRALRRTMRPYFREVEVVTAVPPGAAGSPHAIADVRLDGVEARELITGRLTYVRLRMQWAFAIRPSEASEYLFTFAGVGNSEQTYATLDEGCEQMMLDSMGGLVRGWAEEEVFQAFSTSGGEAPAPDPSAASAGDGDSAAPGPATSAP